MSTVESVTAGARRTERLRLEPITRARTDDLWALHRDPVVAEYYVEEAQWTRDDAQQAAARFESGWQVDGVSKWLAYDRVDGTLVGRGGLSRMAADWYEGLEIGWALLGPCRGRGLATEIGRAALALAFDELGAAEVIAFTEAHNHPSRRVMERLGMAYVRDIVARGLVEGLDGMHDDAPFAVYRIAAPKSDHVAE
jgi:RimJ/RimL family protein N-acetyltransferase